MGDNMSFRITRFVLTFGFVLMTAISLQAQTPGEVGFSLGGVVPQGDFGTYADAGPTGHIRASFHIPQAQMFSGYVDICGALFSSETEEIDVWVQGFGTYAAEKTLSQYSVSLHAGLQIGSDTRRGALRPRAAIAPGIYIFNTQTDVTIIGEDESTLDENDTQAKFGVRGVVGTDVFFSTKWGLSFEFVYDHVTGLHDSYEYDSEGRLQEVSQSARFHSFMVGLVIPLDKP